MSRDEMDRDGLIDVAVVYALPERQWLVGLRLPKGTRVGEAIERSGLAARLPGVDLAGLPVGIFGRPTTRDAELRNGDRVELYRPLLCDPKETRRQRAEAGRPVKPVQRR
jgi:uncharacterized protein